MAAKLYQKNLALREQIQSCTHQNCRLYHTTKTKRRNVLNSLDIIHTLNTCNKSCNSDLLKTTKSFFGMFLKQLQNYYFQKQVITENVLHPLYETSEEF